MAGEPGARRRGLLRSAVDGESRRVTTFELFFDLVFVFAFTQVTQYMASTHTAYGVLQALIVLGVLWWSWIAFAWLGNQTYADEGVAQLGMAVAMGAMFVVALVIPEAYDDLPGGLHPPLVLAVAYTAVRVTHLTLYYLSASDDAGLRRQVLVTAAPLALGCTLLIVGSLIGGAAQTWLWLAGLAGDVAVTYATSRRGNWRVHSASHWSERFGLVVILALGESIVAIGVGVAQEPVSTAILAGTLLAVALSVVLWWLYFDVIALAAERRLTEMTDAERTSVALDGYTILHFAVIAGIIISALGVEEAMHHVASGDPFGLFGACALLGGTSLYLAAQAAFWRLVGGAWKAWRIVGATVMLAVVPVAAVLPALGAIALTVSVAVAVIVVELALHGASRAEVRADLHPTAADPTE